VAVVAGKPVAAVLPSLAQRARLSNAGDAILIPSCRRVDGIQRVLDIARARPQYRFIAVANPAHGHAEQQLLAGAPRNVSGVDIGSVSSGFKLALVPTLNADLPWNTLAECLAGGIPILGSTEPLLVEAVADAGWLLSATSPLGAWLDQLDRIMQSDALPADMVQAAIQRASLLRLAPEVSARQCLQVVGQHMASGAQFVSGRL
jgi:hypothetical protein